jgi:UDP-N-acetylmuramate--alanine ligase
LTLTPIIAAITNVEADHLDCYDNISDIKDAFVTFANKVPFFGTVVCCLDDVGVQSILPFIQKNIVTYGFTRQADVRAINVKYVNFKTYFEVLYKDYNLGSLTINTIGKHNIQNALLAVSVGIELNIAFESIKKGLEEFKGVYRRMEYIGEVEGIKIFDDYAHHPTEILTTLQGLRDNTEDRIVALFQPHLYSRTRDFAVDFGRSFYNADMLIVAPIYPAREEPIEGVSSQLIADIAIQSGHHHVICLQDKAEIMNTLKTVLKKNDILLTIGAGDIHRYGKDYFNGGEK